jgi:hypothetical protein
VFWIHKKNRGLSYHCKKNYLSTPSHSSQNKKRNQLHLNRAWPNNNQVPTTKIQHPSNNNKVTSLVKFDKTANIPKAYYLPKNTLPLDATLPIIQLVKLLFGAYSTVLLHAQLMWDVTLSSSSIGKYSGATCLTSDDFICDCIMAARMKSATGITISHDVIIQCLLRSSRFFHITRPNFLSNIILDLLKRCQNSVQAGVSQAVWKRLHIDFVK